MGLLEGRVVGTVDHAGAELLGFEGPADGIGRLKFQDALGVP